MIALSRTSNNMIENIDSHIIKCQEKIDFHHKNAISSQRWNDALSIINVILTSATGLTMTILTVVESPAIQVTIVGAVYVFLITINDQLKKSYGFLTLSFRHHTANDEYSSLQYELNGLRNSLMRTDLESGISSNQEYEYEKCILKFVSINSKSHIPTVKDCKIFCCFR
jgi:hypothetical protein